MYLIQRVHSGRFHCVSIRTSVLDIARVCVSLIQRVHSGRNKCPGYRCVSLIQRVHSGRFGGFTARILVTLGSVPVTCIGVCLFTN